MRYDFTELKEKIPIASVLSFYRLESRKRSNSELVVNCPFPSHHQSEHKWTLCISTEKGKWFCQQDSCRASSNKPKGGDVIDLVCMLENCSPLEAAKKLSELFALKSNGEGRAAKELIAPSAAESSTGNPPLAFELKLDPTHDFIKDRGITVETAQAFGVGFHKGKGSMANRICFPLRENGHLIGYAGRTILDVTAENPKWKLPNGLVKSFVYGLERCEATSPLILVESCWAVLWLHQQKFQAVSLLGSSMTPEQEKCLDPFHTITVCMDNDAAGREASQKIIERLRATHKVLRAYLND